MSATLYAVAAGIFGALMHLWGYRRGAAHVLAHVETSLRPIAQREWSPADVAEPLPGTGRPLWSKEV